MDIMVGITIGEGYAPAGSESEFEELLVHGLVADNEFVQSAVIMRLDEHGLNTLSWKADESTRQER